MTPMRRTNSSRYYSFSVPSTSHVMTVSSPSSDTHACSFLALLYISAVIVSANFLDSSQSSSLPRVLHASFSPGTVFQSTSGRAFRSLLLLFLRCFLLAVLVAVASYVYVVVVVVALTVAVILLLIIIIIINIISGISSGFHFLATVFVFPRQTMRHPRGDIAPWNLLCGTIAAIFHD